MAFATQPLLSPWYGSKKKTMNGEKYYFSISVPERESA